MTTTPEKVAVDTVSLTIDGISVRVPKGTLVIRAAEQIGVEIPRFCDHPLLAPVGACRQCLVEVWLPGRPNADGTPAPAIQMQGPPGRMKPQASCTLECSEGMEVRTQLTSDGAEKAQKGVMENLLINHPLDCPVCDKGGECPLQNQALSHGQAESRFSESKRTFPKPINVSAQVLLDRERCVLCARCTRFSDEIAGDPFIELVERGALQQVGIYEREPFESYFSGNTIQICPVGALTSADYRFRSRPFDLVSVPAVGEHDACGAAIRIDHRRGKVMRRLAGNEPEINEEWITDKDRFAFAYSRGADRLQVPMIRENGELRAASWPEAFAVAAQGLQSAGSAAVLTGGRLTTEDAYAYSKFARVALETNDIDFRARPLSGEEADFLASNVVLTQGATYRDLEHAGVVVLAGFEPEDEAGSVFLRLRKANRHHGTKVVTLAPFTSRGSHKLAAEVVATPPGGEAKALTKLARGYGLNKTSVILVGERLATVPGALSAAAALAARTKAKLAWVPRRAGDRGAVEAGCLPNLLPGGRPVAEVEARVDLAAAWGVKQLPAKVGRDADEIVKAAVAGKIRALVVGGVDPRDTADPALTQQALKKAKFVVALELRETAVTRAADVVFPVAATVDKPGMFVNWEGRVRAFAAVFSNPSALPDSRVLAGVAEEIGTPLGFRTVAEVRREMEQVGPWEGARVSAPTATEVEVKALTATARKRWLADLAAGREAETKLATWRLLLDNGVMQDGADQLRATARRPVALVSPTALVALGSSHVTVQGDRGTITLPVQSTDIVDGVIWVPGNSYGDGLLADVASPGSVVTVKGAAQ